MNTSPSVLRTTLVLAACLALAAVARAQTAPTPRPASSPTPAPTSDEAVKLSVFEVSAGNDRGYAASTAMSGTRTNEKLENLPNAISVMTADLLADLGALNFLDAADFAVGAENVFNDGATRGAAVGARSGNTITFRGLASVR